jgi:hypothetical protein
MTFLMLFLNNQRIIKWALMTDFFDKNFIYRKEMARVYREATAVTNVSVAVGNTIKELFNLSCSNYQQYCRYQFI